VLAALHCGISAVTAPLTGNGSGRTLAVVGIAVLGPLSVDNDGAALGPRDRVVLAALAVRPGEVVSADRLADALWGDGPPATWPKVVQGCVVRLRKALGAHAIATTPQGYRLDLPVDEVDAQRFVWLVGRGRELLTLGEPERAAHVVGEALALWRGPALTELEGWEPGRIEAERLEELRRDAEEVRLDAALRAGRHRELLAEAQALVAGAPLRERRWALLALAQYQAGRQGEALRTLHQARTVLATELGLDPGPDLIALEAAILRQDPALVAEPAPPEPSAACPYLGLVPYDVGDADAFFGRDADVAACLRRLAAVGVLAVVGPSGCGKSSLVRAGVGAALERDDRRVVLVTPGPHPSDALTVLPASGPTPVLVMDQCEEAVSLCDDIDERARFFAALAAHAERGPLVVALRADRLGELSAYPGFARLVEPGLYLLGAMDEADLRAVIEGPAHQAGLLLEPGLVELLVREAEGEPGALPLLSHALRTTWERREGRTLTVDGYRDSGGIRGAVAQSAEALYGQVPPEQRRLVRDLLMRLVAPGSDGVPVRSRLPRRIVATDPAHDELVERLVDARLVTSDDGVIALAHEALAHAWPRLRGWLDEDVEGQRILRHLTGAADTWEAMGRPDSELYRGARLAQALDWRDHAYADLTPTERAFLDAGQTLADTERRAAEDRARHQARQNRRLRALLSATAIFLVGSIIVGFVAVGQRERARREGRVATARELAAAANANVEVDPERSILLALAAVERSRTDDGSVLHEAEEALHSAVTASRVELRVPGVGGRLDWSPDGTMFVTEGTEGSDTVDIRDARTGESVRSFRSRDRDILDVAFNHDGTLLATTGADGTARIWNTATGQEVHAVAGQPDNDEWLRGAWGPSFSPDGSLFAAAWPGEDVVRILDVATGRVVHEIRSVPAPWVTSFDPTSSRVAVASLRSEKAVVVDVESGNEMFTLQGHRLILMDVAWSPDGTAIAAAGADGRVRILDAGTGSPRFAVSGGPGLMRAIDWSPDSSRLVAGNSDGTATVWLVSEAELWKLVTLSAQDTRTGINGVAFSPDGTRVMTGDFGITATMIWDIGITGDAEVANLPTVAIAYGAATFTADGRHLVATGAGGSVTVWDAHTFKGVRTLGAPAGASPPPTLGGATVLPPVNSGADVFSVDVSRDGRMVATARFDGSVRVWDAETGEDAFTVDPGPTVPGTTWMDVTWNADGDLLAVAANDGSTGRVTIFDRSGRILTVLQEDFGTAVGSVAFSPDGDQVITTRVPVVPYPGPDDGQLVIWDWIEGTVKRTIATPAFIAAASPTGHLVAATNRLSTNLSGETVDVWDTANGRRVATLAGNTGGTMALAFSADGSRLATANADGTVRIWDPHSGQQLLALRGHNAMATSVSFSPDGSRLASVGADGSLRVWALDLDDLIEIAENELTRTLTDQECQQYLHAPRCR
jgi:WD40 repeat protein/DNA-binding SARP family transcriptional activator/energy-coupling factor transporter ATP-binding protein EcfA2